MKRREFITLAGGAAAACPIVARAQKSALPVIGFINPGSPDGNAVYLRGFRQGLKEIGFVEGENVAIEHRWAEGQFDRLPAMAAELVRRQVALVATTGGSSAALAAKAATATIPVVFAVAEDPVGLGLVASLARPGGNLTGVNYFISELTTKRMELLRELASGATRLAVLVNPANGAASRTTLRDVQAVARAKGLQVEIFSASDGSEIETAFAAIARARPDAIFVGSDAWFNNRRVQLALLTARHAIPAAYSVRSYVEAGGLMSYGTNLVEAYRQVGAYAGRILAGAKPSDLPVVQSSRFELVINAPTARMLGLTVPPMLLALADEVIE